jgi:hypothetical protein
MEGGRPDLRGTYLHPDLLLDLSSWISPAAYIRASQIVNNFLVKEKYGSNNNSKISISYNFINLKNDILEDELNTMINEVVESAKNYGK